MWDIAGRGRAEGCPDVPLARECAGLLKGVIEGLRRGCDGRVVGNFADHLVSRNMEMDAGSISHGDVKGAQQELGALSVDGIANPDLTSKSLNSQWLAARISRPPA